MYNLDVKQMLVRQAIESDVPFVCQLQQQWFEENSVYGFVPENEQQIKAALDSYFLVAEADGGIVGFVSGSIRISDALAVIPAGEGYFEIDNLYVLPEFRKQGIGGNLVAKLLVEVKRQGVAYALVYSAAKNIRSILKFYEQHKFQSWNIQMFQKL